MERTGEMEQVAYGVWAVPGSIIRVGQVDDVQSDGTPGQRGCDATLAVCLAPDGHWQPVWQTNGDWTILADAEEQCETAESLGGLDQSRERARAERIEEGAELIYGWAQRVRQLDEANEALAACSEWMEEQADYAHRVAASMAADDGLRR